MPPKERKRMSKILLGSSDRENAPAASAPANAAAEKIVTENAPQEPPRASSTEDESQMPCVMQPCRSSCRGGVDALYRALASVKVQNAQATVPEDRTRIMGILSHSQIGVDAVNKKVANYLREWVRRALDVIVQQQEERMKQAALNEETKQDGLKRPYGLTHAAFCTNVAMLFQRNGEYDAASKSLATSAGMYSTIIWFTHLHVFFRASFFLLAVDMYRKSHDIYKAEWGNTHAYTAATLR
jgi:hypothetical protein